MIFYIIFSTVLIENEQYTTTKITEVGFFCFAYLITHVMSSPYSQPVNFKHTKTGCTVKWFLVNAMYNLNFVYEKS